MVASLGVAPSHLTFHTYCNSETHPRQNVTVAWERGHAWLVPNKEPIPPSVCQRKGQVPQCDESCLQSKSWWTKGSKLYLLRDHQCGRINKNINCWNLLKLVRIEPSLEALSLVSFWNGSVGCLTSSKQFFQNSGRRKPKLTFQIVSVGLEQTRLLARSDHSCVSGVWRPGVDPGGVHPRGLPEPSGMGDVCLRLLLRHDHPLDDRLHRRMPPEQLRLGRRRKTRLHMTGTKSRGWEPDWPCDRVLFVSRTLLITGWRRFSTWAPQWSWLL